MYERLDGNPTIHVDTSASNLPILPQAYFITINYAN